MCWCRRCYSQKAGYKQTGCRQNSNRRFHCVNPLVADFCTRYRGRMQFQGKYGVGYSPAVQRVPGLLFHKCSKCAQSKGLHTFTMRSGKLASRSAIRLDRCYDGSAQTLREKASPGPKL